MSNDPATRITLTGGIVVRAWEPIDEIAGSFSDAVQLDDMDGLIPCTDPGDGRHKLVVASRVLFIEQEAER